MPDALDGYARHITAANTARLPGDRTPFLVAGRTIGWIAPGLAPALERRGLGRAGESFAIPSGEGLEALGAALADEGLYRTHAELFDVIASPGAPPLGRIDRGALPLFGLLAQGVHMNGLVERADGPWLWIGRRAMNKRLDPGKLDHLVAGGIPAGLDARGALTKEAAEEASIPADLAETATPVGTITYTMDRPEGLRRDILSCYDLVLPEDFQPVPADGEVVAFELIPLPEAARLVRDTDQFKFNVTLVLIDLFLRRGLIDPRGPAGQALARGLRGPLA
ncbi:NUDIX domain-containing protein [Ameyamaea chiangmaiensis]|uniref:NUDIX domain-containing protein n=1 Tax=Ameyamaea chiangmaiensis TaxID=442969 RepID=A0A850P3I5_9PROT|nr:NUDIX domain-containing protein [Ameyamaea chiangmaiensis]MBS4074509.1 NUDIX domain-containing protein [Ameyamaea chiangmaiensis]NVN39227.1 NUDIX domain-containing protein [Ameyamaea chiangmaiensis]